MQHHILRHRLSSGVTGLHIDVAAVSSISIGWAERECSAPEDMCAQLLESDQLREVDVLVAIVRWRHGEREAGEQICL